MEKLHGTLRGEGTLTGELTMARASVSVSVDSDVTTGAPGTPARVDNLGTNRDAVLKFTIPQGPRGEKGDPGTPGQDGKDGNDGPMGPQGNPGSDGTTFTPQVSSEGVISWSNDGGKQNPESRNIKGPAGQDGSDGQDGTTFTPQVSSEGVISWSNDGGKPNPTSRNIKGPAGQNGRDGQDGQDGSDGYSPTVAVTNITGGHRVTITDANGAHTFDVMDGETGAAGQDGSDGYSPTVAVTNITGGHRVTITDANGAHTFDVMDGADGQDGSDGQDGQDGSDGTTFTPQVSSEGVISWTNDGGKTNPQPVDIKGPQGDPGEDAELVILKYGVSTWSDFIDAYRNNLVIYCRASSNSDPATGTQGRLAFMAYVNNETNPTEVEFQYYRSVNAHSDAQQGDQVFVYKLTSSGTWTVTTRNTFSKINVGSGLSKSYSNGVLTINLDLQTWTGGTY